jgi:hypothetical protein
MIGDKNRSGRARRLPAVSLPRCSALPDTNRKLLIENVLSPMNREIFGLETNFLPDSREAPSKKEAPGGAPFGDTGTAAQVSRLEKRTVVARAR